MKYRNHAGLLALCAFMVGAFLGTACADGLAARGHGGVEGPLLPPGTAAEAAAPASTGNVLQEQALDRLRAGFEAADVGKSGALTQQQAQQGGLGYVASHFSGIDAGNTGKVSFEDLKRYLQSQK